MTKHLLIIAILLSIGQLTFGQIDDNGVTVDDSLHIRQMMADMERDDYVNVSLLTATPGKHVYSASGHAALRMECPQHSVDYCYEFDNIVSIDVLLYFLRGKLEGLFVRQETSDFVERYRREGRGVTALRLNLTPDEDIRLWQYLDFSTDSIHRWKFDFMDSNCASMVVRAVKGAIDGNIVYRDTPDELNGTFRGTFPLIFKNAPWASFVWNLLMGTGFDSPPSSFEQLLFPKAMTDEWARATIVSPTGEERQLAVAPPIMLLEPVIADESSPFTPVVCFGLLLIVAVPVTILELRSVVVWPARVLDALLLVGVTLLGLLLSYLIFFSDHSASAWNWMFVVFSPLPAIVCLLGRRSPLVRQRFWLLATLVLVAFCLLTPFIPQMQHGAMPLLLLALAVRTAARVTLCKVNDKKKKNNNMY